VLVGRVFGEAEDRRGGLAQSARVFRADEKKKERKPNIRRRTRRLQECRLADVALDVLGLLVDFQLRLGDFRVFGIAFPLRGCLGSLLRTGLVLSNCVG
jgi:hypothetical protein